MRYLIKNATVAGKKADILLENGIISEVSEKITDNDATVIEAEGLTALPAFVDMHTHLREPGFEKKETIESGTAAAVAGGYASVCCMPNTKPVTDNPYIVKYIKDRAAEAGRCKVYPIGAITKGLAGKELAEMGKMKSAGIIAVSDDGNPVESGNVMRLALEYAQDFDILVISHCEDKSLLDGGVANDGVNATLAGLKGITRVAEEAMVAREILLAEALNTKVHIAHVSTVNGVELIRAAKARGVKVTAETCPHYFAATDDLIRNYDTAAKVNPPLREERDRLAIIAGLKDGTLDAIATDHAPHHFSDKEVEFNLAANGISGLETAFSLAYTYLVDKGELTLSELSRLMTARPAEILGIEAGRTEKGAVADLVLVDLNEKWTVDKNKFLSKGKNTPFDGREVKGRVKYTFVSGELKFAKGELV